MTHHPPAADHTSPARTWRARISSKQTTRARRSFTLLALVIAVVTLTGCDDLFAGGWGNNNVGQLGDLADGSTDVPVALDGSQLFAESTIVDVSAQEQSSCALASDGTAACWGRSTTAGAVTDSITPVFVDGSGLFQGKTITAVEAGAGLKCALTSDGMVGCWDQTGERSIDGVLTGKTVIDISVGDGHACALTIDAIVACWGDNSRGQLGDNTTVTRVDPVVVSDTGALVGRTPVAVTAGRRHTCALASDGTATCWGDNTLGQIGDGTQLTRCQPTAVAGTGTASAWNLVGIDAGTSHTCAVTADGRATCWGFNVAGQLGDGQTLTIGTTPQAVDTSGVLVGRSVVEVSAGGNHSCALLNDGSVACWGANFDGQLGTGTRAESAVPVAVSTLGQAAGGASLPVTGLDVGGAHSLAVYEANAPSEFVPIEPVRLLDTRTGEGQPLSSSQYVVVDATGVVPPQATAIAFNITATGQTASGFFEVAPEGAASGSSTINWSGPQQTIANGHITKLSAADTVRITLDSTGLAHGVLDITGYFVPPGAAGGSLLTTTDRRIYDSRLSDGPLPAGQSRVLTIAGGGDALPVTPTSAAINVTVTGTRGSGVLSVAETATSATSTINWSAGAQTVANAVITPVSEAGTFTVTNNGTTPAEVVVDLTGVFGPASQGGAAFYAVDPARTYDSRLTNGVLAAGQTRVGTNPVPDDAVAVAVNTTITGTSGTGFFTASPPPPIGADVSVAPPPPTSTVNWFTSPTTRANGSIIPVSRTALGGYTGGNYGTQYLFDVAGFFR